MLVIHVEAQEFYDGYKEMFFNTKPLTVRLEHSLISISKWEAHYQKPFLPSPTRKGMSGEREELYYISCMIIGSVPDYVPEVIKRTHRAELEEYIGNPHTATTIHRHGMTPPARSTITAELIYYWMIRFGIDISCQQWHFNRLMTLIDVCSLKEQESNKKGSGNKMNALESAQYRQDLNQARKAAL